MIILSALHMYISIGAVYSCLIQTSVSIYVGATRSLSFYTFNTNKKKESDSIIKSDNSLISLKTALSIPILATVSLLGSYYIVQSDIKIIHYLLYGYIIFLGTLCLKKYIYEYLKYQPNFSRLDYII